MDLQTHKATLLHERDQLTTQLQSLGTIDPNIAGDWVSTPEDTETTEADENVVADRAEEWIARNGELSQLETRYNNVLRALEKIDAGTYGLCEICNEPIEDERLAANPAARTCKAHLNEEVSLSM